jgi:iron complex outermembrane recepter protein
MAISADNAEWETVGRRIGFGFSDSTQVKLGRRMGSADSMTETHRRAALVVLALLLLSTSIFADEIALPVVPALVQTTDGDNAKKPPRNGEPRKIPEASDAAPLPRIPLPESPANVKPPPVVEKKIPEASNTTPPPIPSPPETVQSAPPPEASTILEGDNLVSRLAEQARTSATKSASPAYSSAPSTIVEPLQSDVETGATLQQAPSVSLRRTSAINLDARVRGFNAAQINAMADGVNQLKTRIDVDSLFSRIDPRLVDSITVIDGPYSSLYGPGFAFLVADLKAPQRFDSPQGGSASLLGYESNGSQLFWRQEAYAGGNAWGFLSSFGQRIGNDYTPGGDLFRIPASYNVWDGFAAFSLDVGPNQTLNLFYLHHEQNDVELPGVAYDLRQSANSQVNLRYTIWEGDARTERVVLQAWAAETRYHGDNAAASKQATMWGHLIGAPFGPYNNAATGILTGLLTNGGLSTYGARGYIRIGETDDWELIAGADWRLERLFYNETDYHPTGDVAFGGNIFGIPRSSSEAAGLFFHLTGKVDPCIILAAGGRVDAWSANFDAGDPVNTIGDPAIYPTSLFKGQEQPEKFLAMGYLSAKRYLSECVSISGGAAYAMRPPKLDELYSDQPWVPLVRFGNSFSMGDSELKPERMIQFDAGVKGEWERLTVGARAFASSIDEYILYRPMAFGPGATESVPGNGPSNLGRKIGTIDAADDAAVAYQYANIDRATLFGGDLIAEWRMQPWCSAFGSLAYVRGINHDPLVVQPDGSYTSKGAEGLPGVAPLTGVVGVRLFEPHHDRYGVEINGRLVAAQNELADSLGELGTPGYTVWNVRGWVRLSDRLTINSAVRNIFNKDYTQHGSLAIGDPRTGAIFFVPEPGVSWVTSVEVSY